MLQSQADKLKQDLSSSKDKTQELEKLVSELQTYKEQAQVSTSCQRCIRVCLISVFFVCDVKGSLCFIDFTYV